MRLIDTAAPGWPGGRSVGGYDGFTAVRASVSDSFDPEACALFAHLRHHLHASPDQIAAIVGTDGYTILALENGRIGQLPPWHETVRIVQAYTGLVGLDPGPVLHAIAARWPSAPSAPAAQPSYPLVQPGHAGNAEIPPVPSVRANGSLVGRTRPPVPSAGTFVEQHLDQIAEAEDEDAADEARRRRWPRLLLLAVVGLAAVVALTSTLAAGVKRLPAPMSNWMRSAEDAAKSTAARFEGMPLIKVADPRTRKADKLKVATRR